MRTDLHAFSGAFRLGEGEQFEILQGEGAGERLVHAGYDEAERLIGDWTGRVPDEVSLADGVECARQCALNGLAVLKAEIGELSRVGSVVRLGGFVASDPGFGDQPEIINGASELMVKVFGDAGRHARAAVGVAVNATDERLLALAEGEAEVERVVAERQEEARRPPRAECPAHHRRRHRLPALSAR